MMLMRPRALLLFILVNVLVTTGVAFVIISVFGSREDPNTLAQYITVEVIITATRDPDATLPVRIITATPRPGEVVLPSDLVDENTTEEAGIEDNGDPRSLAQGTDEAAVADGTALPENCIPHTLEEGEFPSLLAEEYGVPLNTILIANGLTEETATLLQIGQVLIIPLEGCSIQLPSPTPFEDTAATEEATLDATGEAAALTATATAEVTPTPSITPTITLPPTAVDAAVQIVDVIAPGDITAEALIIRNNGRNVNLTGWTLTDLDGNVYEFPERNLFSNGEITLFTGAGQNTAVVMFWGRDEAVWGEPGDVVTLADANGVVQATFRIPAAVNLP
jgi:LysM repeat protein